MIIVAKYSHKEGEEFLQLRHRAELKEVEEIITSIDATKCKTKVSREKTMKGKVLYSPKKLNNEFMKKFYEKGWIKERIEMITRVPEIGSLHKGFREMDVVKNEVGVEVQFGKYAFMVYNILAKMTIFAKQGIIECGIEIVPMLSMANEMSTGVSYFEQVKSDLEYRGVSNIDIPVLVLGVDVIKRPYQKTLTS